MPRVNVRVPEGLHDQLTELVDGDSMFADKSDATRYALRRMLQYHSDVDGDSDE
jgi:Arc/MetJ-type ribon-helix-helix transcriptional regulator